MEVKLQINRIINLDLCEWIYDRVVRESTFETNNALSRQRDEGHCVPLHEDVIFSWSCRVIRRLDLSSSTREKKIG